MGPLLDALGRLGDGQVMVIGSGPHADVVVPGAGIDARHAQLLRRGGVLYVRDLDSREGTRVNGAEVHGLVGLRPGDRLALGRVEVKIPDAGGRPVAPTASGDVLPAAQRGLSVALVGVTRRVVTRDGLRPVTREILRDVTLEIRPGEFVGILGASGSGKSTLMDLLAGNVTPSSGQVLIDGRAVAADHLRRDRHIAYLPQDVVIHEALTPLVALGYIAGLKGLADDAEGRRRAALAALERVGLLDRGDVPIRRLSGGQRKRVALAAELLGDPGLILLDEATSGLDPATEDEMMRLFRDLAAEGRTVACITHFPGRLDLCDRLLYLADGRMVFCGTPAELRTFFGVRDIEDAFARQRDRTAEEWQRLFLESAAGRVGRVDGLAAGPQQDQQAGPSLGDNPPGGLQQAIDLTVRYARIQLADAKNLLLLLAQAPVISLLIAGTFGDIRVDFAELHAADTKQVMFLLALAVLWCAGTGSVREVVKELPIVRHERRIGLRLVPYLASKLVVLGALALTQALLLLVVVRHRTALTGLPDVQYAVLGMTALAGVGLGLAISALSGTSERAMTLLPVVLIGQAIFSGGLARLQGGTRLVGMALAPAYWTLDGLRATLASDLLNATYPGAPGHYQPPILGPGGPLPVDVLALACQSVALLAAAHLLLIRHLGEVPAWSVPGWPSDRAAGAPGRLPIGGRHPADR
jgi:ABC-type multidrug transport system ATPase subunit